MAETNVGKITQIIGAVLDVKFMERAVRRALPHAESARMNIFVVFLPN